MNENIKKRVYFDYNVFVNYINLKEVKHEIEKKQDEFIYVYSPAFLEEVANIKGDKNRIKTYISQMSNLYSNKILIPTDYAGIQLMEEHPQQCYNRVIRHYSWTEIANEISQMFLLQKPHFKDIRGEHGITTVEINNIAPENLFNDQRINEFLKRNLGFFNLSFFEGDKLAEWLNINKEFHLIQEKISNLFDALEMLGFYPEKEGAYSSRMHDVTHAIYGTQADFLVTEDNRFSQKCKAAYHFLGVPTKVISYKEFTEF